MNLDGSLIIAEPGLAAEVPDDVRADVAVFFREAQALAAEVEDLERIDARQEAALPDAEAAANALLAALRDVKREMDRSGLTATFARYEDLQKRLDATRKVAGLAGEPSSVMIPYVDAASDPPRWMAQGYGPIQGDLDTRWWLYHRPNGAFVAATAANTMDRDESKWLPVWTERFVYFGRNAGDRWGVKDNWSTSHAALKANLERAGQLRRVGRVLNTPDTLTENQRKALIYNEHHGLLPWCRREERCRNGALVCRANERETVTVCDPWPSPPAPAAGSAPRCGIDRINVVAPIGRAGQRLPVINGVPIEGAETFAVAETWLEPTDDATYHTRKWLADGCPAVAVGYHANQTWLQRVSRSAGDVLRDVLTHPGFAAAAIVLTYGSATPLVTSAQGAAAQAGGAAQTLTSAQRAAGQILPGLEQGSRLGSDIFGVSPDYFVARGVQAQTLYNLVRDPKNLSRDLARMIAAGVLVPGYGPIAALILPAEANRVLQRLTVEAFYTIPGYGSLVAHAEKNRARRTALRDKIMKRQMVFLTKYKPLFDIAKAVIAALGAVLIPLTFGFSQLVTSSILLLAETGYALWEMALQFEAQTRALSKAKQDLGRAIQARKDELDALILDLEAELARLEAAGYVARAEGPGAFGLAALAAGVALAMAVGGS